MFRKSEESEWTRFSKALSGKEKEEQATKTESSPAEPATGPASPTPAHRPPTPDVNLSVSTPSPRTLSTGDDVESVIGEQTFFDGTYRSESSIRILGTAQGEIESKRAIFVEGKAKVTAKVTANSVTIAGEVNGQIFCDGRVEIRPTGRVTGEIHAGSLVMQEGAYFEGHLKMANKSGQELHRKADGEARHSST